MEFWLYFKVATVAILGGIIFTSFIKNKSISGLLAIISTFLFALSLSYFSVNILLSKTSIEWKIFSLAPLINSTFLLYVDSLSALFLIIIALVSFCVVLFSWRYLEVYSEYSSKRFYPFLLSLFLSSIGLVVVRDLLFFIVFWEAMTFTSWVLVIFDSQKKEALKGGIQYFISTHVATAFLILAAVIIYSYSEDFNFVEIKKSLTNIFENNSMLAHFLIFSIVIAFITKAGILPFGFWLPNAYPQPPSSASSFFGGVMSKLAVYGLLRFFLSLIPFSQYSHTWGFIIALLGVFSIFVGTIAALTQDEAKRLMSFHAIGQVGYMLLGIGTGIYFVTFSPFLGMIALTGGLLHVFNNSIYKSLLFLNAGTIFYKTGTTDLNKVSGLIKIMPLTAIAAIVGSLSIAGVPPFNGFISKLLIFESSIGVMKVSESFFLIKFAFIIFGIISVFISAITLASFLKFVNSAFMGKLKAEIKKTTAIPSSMNIPQIILAGVCLFTGLFPFITLEFTYHALSSASELTLPSFSSVFSLSIAGFGLNFCQNCIETGVWFPIFVILSVLILSLVIFCFEKYANAPKREVETWYGGKEHSPEEVAYTGHSFYQPFKELVSFKIFNIQFRGFYPVELPPMKFSFPSSLKKIIQPDEWFYYPFIEKIVRIFDLLYSHYENLKENYMAWLVVGGIIVMFFLFSIAGGII